MIEAIITGAFLAAGLIVGLGPQNLFLIRQGLRGKFVLPVTLMCCAGDMILISVASFGFGGVISQNIFLQLVIGGLGVVFLYVYGALNFKSALKPAAEKLKQEKGPKTWQAAVGIVAAFTFLNPWAIIDTMVVIGGVAAQYDIFSHKLAFVVTTIMVAFVWFFSIGYGAKSMKRLFETPRAVQMLDILVGTMMWFVATMLVIKLLGVFQEL